MRVEPHVDPAPQERSGRQNHGRRREVHVHPASDTIYTSPDMTSSATVPWANSRFGWRSSSARTALR